MASTGTWRPASEQPASEQPAGDRTARGLLAAAWATVATNRLFALVLVPAIALRVGAELGYRWQAYFSDSIAYLGDAVYNWPDSTRIAGYAAYLKLLQPLHSLALVTISQHLMGLLVAIMIYALARRFGAPSWLAVLATIPLLYDGFEIQLEHLIMSDTLFLFLAMLALSLLVWTPRPSWWACLLVGLLLGAAAVVRSVGLPLLAVYGVYLIIRLYPLRGRVTGGWRSWRGWVALVAAVASLAATFAIPVYAYEQWYASKHGELAMSDSTGVYLYSRVMSFADCSRLHLTADLTPLCTTVPPGQRPLAQDYIWGSDSPLQKIKAPEFSPQVNKLAEQFAIKAMLGQPVDYARVVFDDTWRAFAWPHTPFPYASTYDNYLFGGQNVTISATEGPGAQTGSNWNYSPNVYLGGNADPRTGVVQPFATIIRVYQEYVWLPGTIYGLILLAGLAGIVLGWRRAGGQALLPWLVSLALIVVPAATAEFDYRYVLTAVPFACLAAAMAFGQQATGWRFTRSRGQHAGPPVSGDGPVREQAIPVPSGRGPASRPVGSFPPGPPAR
jgi:Dolichyl-phosphate-mannose-protein mannosyltransferase